MLMRLFGSLGRRFAWLGVPQPAPAPEIDESGPLPKGIYRFPAGLVLTGHEPLSFYLAHRDGDANEWILLQAVE